MDWQLAVQLALQGRDFTQLETHRFRIGWAIKKRLAGSHGEISNSVAFSLPDMPLVFIRPSSTVFFSICTRFYHKCLSRLDSYRVNWQIDYDKYVMGCTTREKTATLFSQWWNIYLISLIRAHSVWFVKCGYCLWWNGFSLLVLTLVRAHTHTPTCLKYCFPHFPLIFEADNIHMYTSYTSNLCRKTNKKKKTTSLLTVWFM